jgi:hypothetical protein
MHRDDGGTTRHEVQANGGVAAWLLQRGDGADGARSGSDLGLAGLDLGLVGPDLGLAGPDLGLIGTAAMSG